VKRQDIHRPSTPGFDPQEYSLVLVADNNHSDDKLRIEASELLLASDGFSLGHGNSSHCGHCGTALRYVALLKHPASHEYIFVGEQCLGNRFALTRDQFADLRHRATVERHGGSVEVDTRTFAERETDAFTHAAERSERVARGVESLVSEHPQLAWLTYAEEIAEWESVDVRRYSRLLMDSGTLSSRQITQAKESLATSLRQREYRAHADARRASIAAALSNGIDAVFTIEVVRTSPSKFGGTRKSVLLAHDDDWKVWADVRDNALVLLRGSKVRLVAEGYSNTAYANTFAARGKSSISVMDA